MLFLRFTPDRKAEVMEASTGGCNGRVCRNVYPLASLLERGYVPVRFRALADDAMTVAAERLSGGGLADRAVEKAGHGASGEPRHDAAATNVCSPRSVVQGFGRAAPGPDILSSAPG